ncbi:hypothetical protein G6F70_003217 [Rhizopus microsporus]|uniref:Phosphatidic acid phosphatase type 2/haloperoxidase domain-containing protein n=2 Tax=Rhizopus TaxID=4842 RepID=A0A367JWU7_RHIAZ|nr:hypothetical protein G6F71_005657 [Rhizopus microsporus]RCH94413.1 hypothetical protein CU097_013475 [Rhizopus azygosporus]KAG1201350.1 hypothetical protein G6F70_003217 [Rhizopus microsporus]KAG1210074.1 hypothetical protein G6F69_005798 [Rhizopus microsporus]KAG1234236.1 hypothetical protein G6F67_003688 [Rhizopus microsporus]
MKMLLYVLAYTREITIASVSLAILYFRSFHLIYFVIGAILTTLEAKVLKHIIKQPRPDSYKLVSKKKTSYGMPSSHSQAMSFFAAYFQLVTMSSILPEHFRLFGLSASVLAALLSTFSLGVIWSRVQLGHHTVSQVMAGTILGTLSALVWFRLWQAYFSQ